MRTFDLKNLAAIVAFGLVGMLGSAGVANAQSDRQIEKQERKAAKQQEKANKQLAKAERERLRMDSIRQSEWTRQNTRIHTDQKRQTARNSRYSPNSKGGSGVGVGYASAAFERKG